MRYVRGRVVELLFVVAGGSIVFVAQGWLVVQTVAIPAGILLMVIGGLSLLTGLYEWTQIDGYQRLRTAYGLWYLGKREQNAGVRHELLMDAYAILDSMVWTTVPEELVRRASPKELIFLERYTADRSPGYLDRGNPLFWLRNGVHRRLGREYERRTVQREFV